MKNLILVSLFQLTSLLAQSQEKPEIYTTAEGALKGFDVVAFYTNSAAIKGNDSFSYTFKKATWYFSSTQNLNAFKATPEKYLPEYGGWCAYGTSKGYKASSEANTFTFIDGKLYFNYNQAVKKTWLTNTSDFISKANQNWITLKTK